MLLLQIKAEDFFSSLYLYVYSDTTPALPPQQIWFIPRQKILYYCYSALYQLLEQ